MDDPERWHILIVDDDAVDRMAVQRAFKAAAIQVNLVEVGDEASAIAALREHQFDCAFLDYQLAPGDGLSVLQQVRQAGIRTPIVMLTGQQNDLLAVELMKAGASDYLSKAQLSPETLAQTLRTMRRLALAEQEAEWGAKALRFLSDASAILASSLDVELTLRALADLAVPFLADYCAIDLVDQEGKVARVAGAHKDPQRFDDIYRTAEWYLNDRTYMYGTPGVLHSGREDYCFEVTEEFLQLVGRGDEHLKWMRAYGVRSYLCVPLIVQDQTKGALTLVMTDPKRRHGPPELALAKELAQRAATALHHAILYQEARQAVLVRDNFLSVASHELKTPLTTLLGYAGLLKRRMDRGNGLAPRDHRSLEIIVSQSGRLSKMIDLLLDVTRLQAGQFQVQKHPLDLVKLVQRLADELYPMLEQHRFQLDLPDQVMMIDGDEMRLEQVLNNLIQNAIKYSPEGGEIRLRLHQEGGQTVLAIADEGVGIRPEELPYLFDRFYRVNNQAIQHIHGLGLGLYIVKEIIVLHGGTIDVSSEIGTGSTFTIRLPLIADPAPQADLITA